MMNDKQKVIFADIIAAIIAGDEEKTKSLISDYKEMNCSISYLTFRGYLII